MSNEGGGAPSTSPGTHASERHGASRQFEPRPLSTSRCMGGRMLRGLLSMRRIRLITVLALIGFACAALAGWTASARRQARGD